MQQNMIQEQNEICSIQQTCYIQKLIFLNFLKTALRCSSSTYNTNFWIVVLSNAMFLCYRLSVCGHSKLATQAIPAGKQYRPPIKTGEIVEDAIFSSVPGYKLLASNLRLAAEE